MWTAFMISASIAEAGMNLAAYYLVFVLREKRQDLSCRLFLYKESLMFNMEKFFGIFYNGLS